MAILPSNVTEQLFSLVNEGSTFDDRKDYDTAIAHYCEAWKLLPEPKNEWSLSIVVASSLFHSYFRKGDFDKARSWADCAANCKPTDEESVLMYLGMVHYELGDCEKSLEYFDEIHAIAGKRAFRDFPKKYLDFYRQRKSR